ncbi:TonB-dependent receptor [Aurantiacibacter gangjinensis]|uniref:TonB-dependent receptor n=1 Tax=Aurantiacibacter gangjinensis TaxID=502682 RepID=UPI00090A797D|nr:TonB-dependent receptor [Aurantiacibacter gangjinensis]APE27862.1 N-acetylglucosamine-regulated TonB-dependent outer membrane receptor [Aurantiacibacter gangjinensis]
MKARIDNRNVSPAGRVRALAGVSGLALCMATSNVAMAQDAGEPGDGVEQEEEEETTNTIVVSGFRASLESAQDFKENADTFVDVITAEDIGALADRSVAEALQRVPGVNISRFEQRDDPDRFSVEGSGVIIRGLPFVRSELNGRDIFSANGGRVLSFNDISPELLGRVEVFKNTTADMIEGGISGTVNLVTRNPLDNPGFNIAGTIEANVGDLANEWSPGFSVLASNTFDSGIGTFGLQLAYAQQELVTRTDASQITDPCYRAPTLDGPCFRASTVSSGGVGDVIADASNFPPEGTVIVPKGGGVRTTDLTRDRNAYSAVAQFESLDGRFLVTAEYLRADVEGSLNEFSILALVNDDTLFPVPVAGITPTFDERGILQTGTFTQNAGPGIPTENLRFQREDDATTEDFSVDVDLELTDRFRANFEGQVISSDRSEDGIILVTSTYSDIAIDNSVETPQIQFLQPGTSGGGDYFTDPSRTFYWFNLDNQVENDGELYTLRGDFEYDLSDNGFLRGARFGARWSDRARTTRTANFSNWSNLGAPWTGRNGCWSSQDPNNPEGCIFPPGAFPPGGGAYAIDFPDQADIFNPFGDDFQRGNAPAPTPGGAAIFYGGDNLVDAYLNGSLDGDLQDIRDFTLTPEGRPFIGGRAGLVPGTPFLPGEISDVEEETLAAYLRVDFERDFGGATLQGNIGLRWVETTVRSDGEISFPLPDFFDTPTTVNGVTVGNGDGVVQPEEITGRCTQVQPGQIAPGYCSLSDARVAQFASVFTGEVIDDSADVTYDNWLPSFNVKLDLNNGLLFRGAVSRGIFRPDLAAYRTGGAIFDNTNNLRQGGTLETGPLFQIFTGNRLLRPTESWNYDLSAEYYFAEVGSVTLSLFAKEISELENFGANVRNFSSPSGVSTDVLVQGPVNLEDGTLYGVEFAHQQVYDFLPGPLAGLGTVFTYTYVDGGEFANNTLGAEQSPFAAGLPLAGISEHTINAVLFYEMYGISARAAYNWRSDFLQTPRDVIFPFSPIYGESTGQLDASIFYDLTDSIKIGVQGVNLLDEVTNTSQVFDFDGTRVTRSAFRNDRRFTFLVRFDF